MFQAILAILKIITLFDKWVPMIIKWFQKNPVKELKKAEEKHEEATKKAATGDDTGDLFGS